MMKTFTKILMLLAFSFLTENALAKIIYVNAANGAAVTKDGTTWANAYFSLQDAIDNSVNGDEIWVAKGVYKPSVNAPGLSVTANSRHNTFFIPDGVKLYGGFIGNELANVDLNTRDFVTNETILSGDIGIQANNSDNVYHVVTIVGHLTDTFIFDGFTVRDGNGDSNNVTASISKNSTSYPYYTFYGAGIFLREAGGIFRNTIVKNNLVNNQSGTNAVYGGGLFCAGSKSVVIEKASFVENKSSISGTATGSSFAGGIFSSAAITLTDVTFIGNETGNVGGAFYTNVNGIVEITLNRTKFINNIAGTSGGAVGFGGSSSKEVILNSFFYNNDAQSGTAGGGAIYHAGAGTLNLINSTLYANKATGASGTAGGVYMTSAGTILNVHNSIVLDNTSTTGIQDLRRANGTLTITNSITQGATGTNVNTTATAAGVFKSTTYGDADFLRLRTDDTNPAIDAGDNSNYNVLLYGNTDLAGNTRTFNSGLKTTATIDMGAYENIITPLPIILSSALSAKINGNTVQVNWATASETNSSHFVLEKSTDGVNFITIATPVSKGNGGNYSHTDYSPASGVSYYRLSQVDKDGTKVTFDPVVVNFSLQDKSSVNVYPNPAVGGKITINLAGNKFTKLQLVNLQGQSLQSLNIAANETEKTLDISNYPSGTYFIFLSDGTNITTKKVIKP